MWVLSIYLCIYDLDNLCINEYLYVLFHESESIFKTFDNVFVLLMDQIYFMYVVIPCEYLKNKYFVTFYYRKSVFGASWNSFWYGFGGLKRSWA